MGALPKVKGPHIRNIGVRPLSFSSALSLCRSRATRRERLEKLRVSTLSAEERFREQMVSETAWAMMQAREAGFRQMRLLQQGYWEIWLLREDCFCFRVDR